MTTVNEELDKFLVEKWDDGRENFSQGLLSMHTNQPLMKSYHWIWDSKGKYAGRLCIKQRSEQQMNKRC